MKTTSLAPLLFALPLALLTPGCSTEGEHHHDHGAAAHESSWASVKQLAAVIKPTAGNQCSGVVRFTEVGDKVYVFAELEGLTPNAKHAMHIHEFGDATGTDGMKAGGHYNPEGHAHGLPETAARHAGDLGNVQADANGKATYRLTVENVTMVGLKNPIIGRGVIVHAKTDDGGQPTGNAGARIGVGVIGIANPPTQ
ncbi:MAG: superoxide dismutase family protein [Verrucomicrobia bacterium]|nr:superoxide dismutase family protein [Verrucomicrobiota bacterium]